MLLALALLALALLVLLPALPLPLPLLVRRPHHVCWMHRLLLLLLPSIQQHPPQDFQTADPPLLQGAGTTRQDARLAALSSSTALAVVWKA